MPRHKLGPLFSKFTRAVGTVTPLILNPTASAKADVTLTFSGVDTGSDPLEITITLPGYDVATHNKLEQVTAVVIPFGAIKHVDADGYLASSFAKASISLAPATPAGMGTSPLAPAIPAISAGIAAETGIAALIDTSAPQSTTMVNSLPVAQVAPVVQVAPIASPAPTPIAPVVTVQAIATTLPDSATGGEVLIAVPGVPDGQFEIQLIETYDV